MKVCFLGLGYIGLPTAIVAAKNGHEVFGFDVNRDVVASVNAGHLHFVEPGLAEMLRDVVERKQLQAFDKPQQADVYVVVVPTPFKDDHQPDITFVEEATKAVVPLLKKGDLFIIESTSPVGTTEKMMHQILTARPELQGQIAVAYCPERVLPGNVIFELVNNDRVIGGIDEFSTDLAVKFYSQFVKGTLHRTNCRTAEMCKLTENSFRDIQIAFANELSVVCDKAGIDVWQLIELANRHPRVNILKPGCGVGGHCIAVDPYFITSAFPEEAKLIAHARKVNDDKTSWCVEKINQEIEIFYSKNKKQPRVALMGLAFKADIDDLRESPALKIASQMSCQNNAEFYFVEPNLKEHNTFKLVDYQTAFKKADIVVFLVAHTPFKTLERRKDAVILDFCGVFK